MSGGVSKAPKVDAAPDEVPPAKGSAGMTPETVADPEAEPVTA